MTTETLPQANHEHSLPELSIGEAISGVADTHGLVLGGARLDKLVGLAESAQQQVHAAALMERMGYSFTQVFADSENGLRILKLDTEDGKRAVAVDFTPSAQGEDDDIVSDTTSARPENATDFTLKGIQGMQNFALLVEAGYIQKPDILSATTNPEMAIMVERMGMLSDAARRYGGNNKQAHEEIRASDKVAISGTFDDISAQLFSVEVQRLERLLVRRQSVAGAVGGVMLPRSVS